MPSSPFLLCLADRQTSEPQPHREIEQHLKHVSPLAGFEDLALAVESDPTANRLVTELLDHEQLIAQAFHLEDPKAPTPEIKAMVTKLLSRAEMLSNPKALEAIRAKADGLVKAGTWDLSSVREKEDVRKEAKAPFGCVSALWSAHDHRVH